MSRRVCALLLLGMAAARLRADEGMWTFDNPPRERLQKAYGFEPTQAWLDQVRLASVRFMDGGSGSFVSADGLMITNQHVGIGCIQNVSSAGNDFVTDGFYAPTREQERPCPGYEVNVLLEMQDVTATVAAALKAARTDQQAADAKRAVVARVENECHARTKLRCNVVELYQGGQFALYQYKAYTDVRLVMAPEQQAAFFGGDPDNFVYPRYNLDITFFRAYEEGRPVKPKAFLPWATRPVQEGDLVFVSGNPGSTSRLETIAQLESRRDVSEPMMIEFIKRRLALLGTYGQGSPERERQARALVLNLENSRKAREGRLAALQDAKAFATKVAQEQELRRRVASHPDLAKTAGSAWDEIAAAQKKKDARFAEGLHAQLRQATLAQVALQIVRLVEEVRKPNAERLPDYVDSNLELLKNELLSPAPLYPELEQAILEDALRGAQERLGDASPLVKAALGGRAPAEVAKDAVAGTRLADAQARRALVEGGAAAVAGSTDPMIVFARRVDPAIRAVERSDEDDDAALLRAGRRIAEARFKVYGRTLPPDATFTLRLSFGTVKSYAMEGTVAPVRTTFHGLFDRAASFDEKPPFELPRRFKEKKDALDLATPFNFISTADIIGGNSGSPTLSRAGEFVGIAFDGNIHSLAWDFYFTEERGRCLSVDAQGILEALRKVYGTDALLKELTGRP
jgi:hypothetical protein